MNSNGHSSQTQPSMAVVPDRSSSPPSSPSPPVPKTSSIMPSILSESVYMPDGWNIKDILRSNSAALSEQLSSYSNLGRSLIGSTIGLDDLNYDSYDADRDMEWQEPWVEVDISDFRTRVAGSPDSVDMENRYFDKNANIQLLIGENILEKVSAYSMGTGDDMEGPVLGALFLTNYRLVFYAENMHWDVPKYSIAEVIDCPPLKTGPKFFITLDINTKTFLNYRVGFTFDVSNYKIYDELTTPTVEAIRMMNILETRLHGSAYSRIESSSENINNPMVTAVCVKGSSDAVAGIVTGRIENQNKLHNCFAFHFKPTIMHQQLHASTSRRPAKSKKNAPQGSDSVANGARHVLPGWANFDLDDEYRRLGLLKRIGGGPHDVLGSLAGSVLPWRLTEANKDFQLCTTYPTKFIVPRGISDEALKRIASFRSKGRIPAIVYRHPSNNATISRCAQPMVGLVRRARCPDDERYIKQLIPDAKENKDVYIIDCRSQAAAYGNLAVGRGFEFSANYGGSKLLFMNIENIHAMRESCKRIVELGATAWRSCGEGDSRWWSHLEATRWLEHIRSLLAAASMCARIISDGHSILIHCSDGWDRTPQLSALSQILIDPYYRTIRGFAILVEKDWCAFGHQFALRCGHGNHKYSEDENCSPIFLQFIDCVFQLVHQFPSSFEFNQHFLIDMLDEVYACRTSTFLGNSDMERTLSNVNEKCVSAWALLLPPHARNTKAYRMHKYVNPIYDGFDDARYYVGSDSSSKLPENACKDVLLPDCHQSAIKIWSDYYFRQMKSHMKRINYDGVASLSTSTNVKVDDKVRKIVEKSSILSAKNARLRREKDMLQRKIKMLKLKVMSQQQKHEHVQHGSSYVDVDGYVSVHGRRKSTPPIPSNGISNSKKPHRRSSLFNLSFSRWGNSRGSTSNSAKQGFISGTNPFAGSFKSSR